MRKTSNFRRQDAGTVAVVAALSLTLICAVTGGAIDFGRAFSTKSRLSAAADAAALAGAVALQDQRVAAATALFSRVYGGNVTPAVSTSGTRVFVTVSEPVKTTFLNVIGMSEINVHVESEAAVGAASGAPQCILLLETSQIGLTANSDSKLDASCGIHVNSSNSEALFANSNSHILATDIGVHGQTRLNSGSTATPAPVDGSVPKPDPLVSLAEPSNATGACNFTDFTVNSGQTQVMVPGVYCKKTLINSGSTAIMQPGVYVFRDGEFEINSLSTVTGSGVMMYFHNKAARLNVNSDSVFEVSAPVSGFYAGILMFQGRQSENSMAAPFIVNSDGRTKLEGTIYLPLGTLELNSQSAANQLAAYTAIVARQMVLNSFGTMSVGSDFEGPTPLPPLLTSFRNVTVARLTK